MNRPTHPHSFSAHLALVVANVLFGMNFSFFVSIIRHYMAFETLFFARVLFSAVCFIPLTFLYKRFRITRRDFIGILIPTVLVIYGHEFMMLWGAKYTNPLDASTLATMAPIVTLVVSSLIFRERLHWAKIVGIGMGIAGSAVLILGNGWPKMQSEELGNLFMLVSVVAAATNTVFIKPELVRLGTMTVTGWYYVIGVLIAGPFFGRDVFEFDYGSLPPLAVAEIVYVLVLGTTLPNYLLYYGTEKLTSVHTGLYAYLQPIAATALGLYRHQIELGYDNLVAAILIFVGIVLVIITYVKFRFPAPGAGKTSGGDRSEPVSVPGVSVPPPAGGERGRSDGSAGSFGTSRPVAGSIREEAEFRGKRRDVCVVSDNRSIFRTENRQRLPEPCMRGAGGCPRPSAESLGGGRAERRRAVRVPGPAKCENESNTR